MVLALGKVEARDRVEARGRVVRVVGRRVLVLRKVALVQGRRVVRARVVRMGGLVLVAGGVIQGAQWCSTKRPPGTDPAPSMDAVSKRIAIRA